MSRSSDQSMKFVVFKLATGDFGVDIAKINTILRLQPVIRLPFSGEICEGVFNHRGQPILLIDLRKKMGLPVKFDKQEDMRIVVVDLNPVLMGFIVDRVVEVKDILFQTLEPVPESFIDFDIEQESLLAIANINRGEQIILLLDLAKIFTDAELEALSKILQRSDDILNIMRSDDKEIVDYASMAAGVK